MFGKIFSSMYDGTLADSWQALVTFQQMIVLCNADGVVDMTPAAISRKTGIPIEVITEGISVLECPDVSSRTPDEDGRRIMRLDNHRDWGWFIVNHTKYRDMANTSEKRARDAERKRVMRENRKNSSENQIDGQVRTGADASGTASDGGGTGADESEMSAHTDNRYQITDNNNTHTPAREQFQKLKIHDAVEPQWAESWASWLDTWEARTEKPFNATLALHQLTELAQKPPEKARADLDFSLSKLAKSILDSDNDFSKPRAGSPPRKQLTEF